MNITHVKWNTEKPKFGDVEGKYVLIQWTSSVGVVHRETHEIVSKNDMIVFDDDPPGVVFNYYAVLSDEPAYCEWINKGAYWQGCGGQWSLVYKFCPHCGNPIKVIDELKPLQLMGIEPVIQNESGGFYAMWYKLETEEKFVLKTYPTKREAIESWNLLVKKLTGEK
jgi:hypothetical protein